MWGMHRWRWIAAAAVVTAAAGVLVVGGFPSSAEAWADRRVAGCPGAVVPHGPVSPPQAAAPDRPRDPADYRMGTLRAAGCQAWLRLHRPGHRHGS
jgi:hypothetical protein